MTQGQVNWERQSTRERSREDKWVREYMGDGVPWITLKRAAAKRGWAVIRLDRVLDRVGAQLVKIADGTVVARMDPRRTRLTSHKS